MKPAYLYGALIILVVAGIIFAKNNSTKDRVEVVSAYDTFAQCLTDAGAKFYGAFWCTHCQAQKKLFDNSKKLPYIECSTPDTKGQTQQCIDAKVTTYPTWDFADGSRTEGEQTFADLAAKTNCPLPQ